MIITTSRARRARRALASKAHGFTLIELLTVIAIIAILAAILFPVFAKAREKAITADCTSNVKQLVLGFMMYVQDYDQRFPSAGNYVAGASRGSDWVRIVTPGTAGTISVEQGSLFTYIKSAELYTCKNGSMSAEKYDDGTNEWTRTSYTMNGNLVASDWTGIKSTRVAFPAQTFLLIEEQDETIGASTGGYNDGVFYAPYYAAAPGAHDLPAGQDEAHSRHGIGSLAGFVDGHAKWLPFTQLTPYTLEGGKGGNLAWYFPRRSKADVYP